MHTTAKETNLLYEKGDQLEIFRRLSKDFSKIYSKVDGLLGDFVVPFWVNINNQLASQFSENMPENFLTLPQLTQTMFSSNKDWASKHLEYCKSRYNEDVLKSLLKEDLVGDPPIYNEKYLASCNTVHHMNHWGKFFEHTPHGVSDIENIIEWGGGYGRYPVLCKRLIPNLKTYVIIDIPVFSCVQYIYNASIHGEDAVNLVTPIEPEVKEGKINLVPVGLAHRVQEDFDLFIAMWSLSESNFKSLEFVEQCNFFNANKIMMALHANQSSMLPAGKRLYDIMDQKCKMVPTGFVNQHYYAFK